MIVLLVQFTAKAGSEQQCLELMRILEDHTRREPGCRHYIAHQSLENPGHFMFYEAYDDQAALDAHRAAPYFKQYVTEGLGKLMESTARELYSPVS